MLSLNELPMASSASSLPAELHTGFVAQSGGGPSAALVDSWRQSLHRHVLHAAATAYVVPNVRLLPDVAGGRVLIWSGKQSGALPNMSAVGTRASDRWRALTGWVAWKRSKQDVQSAFVYAPSAGRVASLALRAAFATAYRRPNPVVAAFERLRSIPANWDGAGGVPPTPSAVQAAQELVERALERFWWVGGVDLSPQDIVPIGGGALAFDWHAGRSSLSVEVGPAGEFGYLLDDQRGQERRFQEADGVSMTDVLRLLGAFLASHATA